MNVTMREVCEAYGTLNGFSSESTALMLTWLRVESQPGEDADNWSTRFEEHWWASHPMSEPWRTFQATSWGGFQMMGFNLPNVDVYNPDAFLMDVEWQIREHVRHVRWLCGRNNHLSEVIERYNGAGAAARAYRQRFENILLQEYGWDIYSQELPLQQVYQPLPQSVVVTGPSSRSPSSLPLSVGLAVTLALIAANS